MKNLYYLAFALIGAVSAPFAQLGAQNQTPTAVVAQAESLIGDEDFDSARRILENHLTTIPKARRTPRAVYLLGLCDYELGRYENARDWLEEAADKGVADADLYLGRLAFLDYEFDKAGQMYGRYAQRKGTTAPDLEDFRRELSTATSALGSVDRITVIDSIAINAADFFRVYRLSPQSGRIDGPDCIPFEDGRRFATTSFTNEKGNFMMWAQPDSLGFTRIAESTRLTDGKWQEQVLAPFELNGGGDADFPFMMPDGTTLYFASDGEGSIGGLDIFVAGRDPQTGEYLAPRNLGMPYNSPYDDFMLAIDEINGVGWWATDRNLLGDLVTVYVYKLNEARNNIDPEDPGLMAAARLSDWRSTIKAAAAEGDSDEGPDHDAVAEEIERKREEIASTPDAWDPDADRVDFTFPLGHGRTCHFLRDFKNPRAKAMMEQYLREEKRLDENQGKLSELRRKYHDTKNDAAKRAMVQAIVTYENTVSEIRDTLKRLRSDIIKTETDSK